MLAFNSRSEDCARHVGVWAGLPVSGAIGCLERFPLWVILVQGLTGRITESSVVKRFHVGLTLLNVIDSSTEGFLEILANV